MSACQLFPPLSVGCLLVPGVQDTRTAVSFAFAAINTEFFSVKVLLQCAMVTACCSVHAVCHGHGLLQCTTTLFTLFSANKASLTQCPYPLILI